MKNKFSVNENNRLMIQSPRAGMPLVPRGEFSTDKNNWLVYHIKEPSALRKKWGLPAKLIFEGRWRLNSDYHLEFVLSDTKDYDGGERLVLKGNIVSVDNDKIAFEAVTRSERGVTHFQILELTGAWQADEYNRIIFAVKKKTAPDTLTLEGDWQLNRRQQITYTYERAELARKARTSRTLTFKGFWEINATDRLTYIFERGNNSRFDFRVQAESPNLYPQRGVIKYRLGVGVRQAKRPRAKIISLYGAWKFSRTLGLCFEMDYGQGKVKSISFGTEVSLAKQQSITFALLNTKGAPLGFCITFSHRFLRKLSAETFLRLIKTGKEMRFEGGVRVPF